MDILDSEKKLRKRIWWCCRIRDPLLALGLKRPIIIPPDENDVSELSLNDFDLDSATTSHPGLRKMGLTWHHSNIRRLRVTCIQEAKLHRCLSKIMTKQYSLGDYRPPTSLADPKSTKAVLLPQTSDSAWNNLFECERELNSWYEALPSELRFNEISNDSTETVFDAANVFRAVLLMTYHTSIITLYRPWVRRCHLKSTQNGAEDPNFQERIQSAIRAAAFSITNLVVELHEADLARHLSQTALSAMCAAVISHIADIASGDDSLRAPAIKGFEQCSHMLNELRENYYSADFTANLVGLIAQAKQLPNVVRNMRSLEHARSPSYDMNDQLSAHQKFTRDETAMATQTNPSAQIDLAGAYFPPLMDFDFGIDTGGQDALGFQRSLQGQLPPLPDAAADSESHRNFREESTRLLSDFFDDQQFGIFNSLPAIDLGS
jgi:hypothetical protein